ncbi:unnamed protein product [Spirodela intermedia]|uniref:Uncharacterized protein n=1 Tax=Spirodela intermedia TaxID=51605 RepID=A0A7I8JZF1_SPIIN|nr:unnamed protein product [Spirodela intermedia]
MANGEPSPSSPASATGGGAAAYPLSQSKDTDRRRPIDAKMAELNESQAEVAAKLQGSKQEDPISFRIRTLKKLPQELQNWRLKLDTQELSVLKKSLGTDVEQLKSEFEALRTTLQQQQEDVANSLRNLGQKCIGARKSKASKEIMEAEEKPEKVHSATSGNKVPYT